MNQISPRPPLGQKSPKLSSAEIREGKEWMRRVKELPCAICRKSGPSDVHHVIHGRYGTRRAPDKDTIPLCKAHHQDGPEAIHQGKASWAEKHGHDYSYLPWVAALLGEIDF